MKKKHFTYAKKTLSVFLAVLMLMTSWVFFPGMLPEAGAAAAATQLYGMNPALDSYLTGYLKSYKTDNNNEYIVVKYPKEIYLDVNETLQDAGYKITVNEIKYGSGDYRVVLFPSIFGGAGEVTKDADFHTNAFSGYGVTALDSANGSAIATANYNTNSTGNTTYIQEDNSGSYNGVTFWLQGTPKGAAGTSFNYSAKTGDSIIWINQKKNGCGNWEDMKTQYINGNADKMADANGNTGADINMTVYFYDKEQLNTIVGTANTYYEANKNYSSYAVGNTWTNFTSARTNGSSVLTNRQVKQGNSNTAGTIEHAESTLNAANNALKFAANNASLISKVAEARALQAKAGYETLYSSDSKDALDNAIKAATASPLYTATPEYYANKVEGAKAGEKAIADQNTITGLINGITVAMNGLVRKYDVGYDNLFSFTDWALYPVKSAPSNSTFEIDADKGTISFTHDGSTSGTDNNTSQGTDANWYKAKVKGDTEYVLTWKTEGSGRGQIHVFYTTGNAWTYTANSNYNSGSHWFVNTGKDLPYSSAMGTHVETFKTLPETDGLVFRFGTCNSGDSITFSDIRLVEKSVYDDYAKNYSTARESFFAGDAKALGLLPSRGEDYAFIGWFKADGTPVTDVTSFTSSSIVYAHWNKKLTVQFKNIDGTVLKTEKLAPGGNATAPAAPSKAPDEQYEYAFDGWDRDFTNVQSDLIVTAKFRNESHKNIQYVETQPADCETPGYIVKFCSSCGYQWNNGEEFFDANQEYSKPTGHNCTSVVTGSTTGVDGTHKLACTNYGCKYGADGGPYTIDDPNGHNYKLDATHPGSDGTCTEKGKTYYKCACGQEKVEEGQTNPGNHVNTVLRDNYPADCLNDGHEGNYYCLACGEMTEAGNVIPALGHSFTKYESNNNAECEKNGTETAKCDRCDETHTREDENSALEHAWEEVEDDQYLATPADCENDATYYYVCSACGVSSKDKDGSTWTDEDTKWNHKFDGAYVDKGNGTHTQKCTNSNCDAESDPVSCTYGEWETTETTHKHTCIYCKYTTAEEGHIWDGWSQDANNSGNAAGNQTHKCTVCERVETVQCTDYESVKTEATCEKDAYTTYTCKDCGHGYTVIHEDTATGHNFTKDYKYDADTDKHQQLCANGCGSYGVGTEKDAWADCVWSYKNKEDGIHTATCVCGNSEEQECSGGTATCTAPAKCQFCTEDYGTTSDHSFTGDAVILDGDVHAKLCVYCGEETDYYGIGTEKDATESCTGGEATCMEKATCTVCGDKHGEIDEDAHKWITPPVADTNEDGTHTHTYTCEYNSEHTKKEECFPGIAGVVPPTCNEAGYTVLECQDCADRWETDPVDALGHEWSEWVSDEVVEGQPHTHTRTCLRECGYEDNYQTVECTKEEASKVVTKPTCTTDGYTTYTCNFCEYVWIDDVVDALGHNYTQKIRDEAHLKEAANCEHANIYYYDCSRCDRSAEDIEEGETYTGDVTYFDGKVRAHDWQNKADAKYLANVATCFAAAKYYTSCSYEDCAKSSEEVNGAGKGVKFSYGSPLEHDWKEIKLEEYLATKADCITDATYYYECSLCKSSSKDEGDGATWIDEGSKAGHDFDHEDGHKEATAATCTADGNYEYWHCETCNKYFKDADGNDAYTGKSATVIKALKHKDTLVKVPFKAPTCTEDGNPAYEYCTACNYNTLPGGVIPDGYKATGHDFTGTYVCDEANGYHSWKCLNGCGNSGMVVDGEQIAYNYNGENTVGGVKCTFAEDYTKEEIEGVYYHSHKCVCGNSDREECTPTTQTFVPDCEKDGYTLNTCNKCGNVWKTDIVESEGHDWSDTPVSNNDGKTHSVKCSKCSAVSSTENCSGGNATCKDKAVCEKCGQSYGDTTGHKFTQAWIYQDNAACGVNGTEKNTCDICGTEVTREKEGSALQHKMSDYGYEVPAKLEAILEAAGIVIVAPTCGAEGRSISYCQNEGCTHYITTRVPKDSDGHKYGDWVADSIGDCSTGVKYTKTCTVCGATDTKIEKDIPHSFEETYHRLPECEKEGHIELTCTVCDKKEDRYYDESKADDPDYEYAHLAPLGHEVDTWTEIAGNCKENGYKTGACARCAKVVTEEIEGKGEHTWKDVAGLVPGCENGGYSAHKQCTVCGATEGKEVYDAYGHNDTNGDGKCEDCNRTIYETDEGSKSCGCICHKDNFLMKILYKILNFFWKLFKISKTCDCGNVHW